MKDIQHGAVQAGLAKIDELLSKRIKRRRLTSREKANLMSMITCTTGGDGFGGCEVIIEAVVEDMAIKKSVFRDMEEKVSDGTLLASNTSALSISEMQSVLRHPERMVGLHFFNPVDRMMLVEVVEGAQTSEETLRRAEAIATQIGKIPIRVKDKPGFAVNRMLAPYLNEAARLFEEGYHPQRVDQALRKFGMAMGPFELLDEVGLDVAGKVGVFLHSQFGERMQPAGVMETLMGSGLLGKKSGRGFYLHGKKRSAHPNPEALRLGGASGDTFKPDAPDMWVERLVLPIVNEAAMILQERVVEEAALLDLAMVLGTGFAPFRGGPLRYADSVGVERIVRSMQSLKEERFAPAELLKELASSNSRFYAEGEKELVTAGES